MLLILDIINYDFTECNIYDRIIINFPGYLHKKHDCEVDEMRELEERIIRDGKIYKDNVLKVDSFLNHQMDVDFFCKMAKEFKARFEGCGVNKILTIEASGIGIASITALEFHCPLVFAKKGATKNLSKDVYSAQVFSYTHNRAYEAMVSKDYLGPDDCILIIDDFLANGEATSGLISIVEQAGAKLAGVGIVIEKAFQPGGKKLREAGVKLESLAMISALDEEKGVSFCD